MQNMPIGIFRGDDTDAFGYQTIVGTIKTDLDLTGCKAVFRYLGFSMEFNPIPEDKKLTIVIPADETKKFPPGLGYASLRVYDSEGRLKTFSNRIMVFVATKTPMFGSDEFEVDFNVRASLEPLKFFVGPNPDDFDEYRGYVEKVIDRASAAKYGLAILLDAIDSNLGAKDGVAATPVAVKAAYAAIIEKLTDDYYTAEQTDEAIDRVAAYYITYDAAGNPFPTYAALVSAQTVYSGGKVRIPTRNDYCVVLADETHDNAEYRYIYAVADGDTTGSWQPQFPVEGVMTVDQTVMKNSQNPVSGGGVWKALWGTATTGFSSLYDWCVAQLAGKASKVDATLTEKWTPAFALTEEQKEVFSSTPGASDNDFALTVGKSNAGTWTLYVGSYNAASLTTDASGNLVLSGGDARLNLQVGDLVATPSGYQLGSQTDKPVASEAEAEALRTEVAGKASKSDVDPLLFAQYYPDGSVKSAAEFTSDIKYDDPDTTNRTITVKPFCQTSDTANDNSDLSGRVVIPPFVDMQGNPYISDDGTRFKVVGVSDGSPAGPNTNLTAIVAPNTVTNIGKNVFSDCYSLILASLPAATGIGDFVFTLCTALTSVDFGGTPRSFVPTLGAYAFSGVPETCTIIVPYAQYDEWKAAEGWNYLQQDFVRHAEKADKPATFTPGNLAALDAQGNPTDSQIPAANVALQGNIPYDLGTTIVIDTASSEVVEGETVNYGAATLADRTANIVQVTAATPLDELRITFPAATSGKVRDFGLRVEIGTGSAALAAPALVPIAPTGETIKIENADGTIPELADGTATAKGVTLLYFSENAPGVFVVKGEQVEEVA